MSLSTDAVLVISLGRAPKALTNDLPSFLFYKGRQQGFERVSDLTNAGGNNCMSGEIWAAGFDYVTPYDLTDWLQTIPWQHPKYVTALIQFEGDDGVMVWNPVDGIIVDTESIR